MNSEKIITPKILDDTWCREYALTALGCKGISCPDAETIEAEYHSVQKAFRTVYRAVAFDIDGTLTRPGVIDVDAKMAMVVRRLLLRSVPVFLITGRGRTSARSAVNAIMEMTSIPTWYARRLYCVTHNGVFLLSTTTDDSQKILYQEKILTEYNRIDDLELQLRKKIANQDIRITREPQSIRILIGKCGDPNSNIKNEICKMISEFNQKEDELFLTCGLWGEELCYDIAPTNKKLALEHCARYLGIPEARILRIGDQGHEGGNDFGLLCSPAGFCVGKLTSQPGVCHPVLTGVPPSKMLTGAEATIELLNTVLLFSPLSIAPEEPGANLEQLRHFEGLALLRSRRETSVLQNRLRIRMKHIIDDDKDTANSSSIEIRDIYDVRSGGVKFYDWEIAHIDLNSSFPQLFDLDELLNIHNMPPKSRMSMFTDTGILLRGSFYYYSMVTVKSDHLIIDYVHESIDFLEKLIKCIDDITDIKPNFIICKFFIGALDNVRNVLLKLFYIQFITSQETRKVELIDQAIKFYNEALCPHTEYYYKVLLDPDADWHSYINRYRNILLKIIDTMHLTLDSAMRGDIINDVDGKSTLRNWRENDNFIENVVAVQLGLHQLYQIKEVREKDHIHMVGLMYGGAELPIIGKIVAGAKGFKAEPVFLKVSLYGDRKLGDMVRNGEPHYVTEMLRERRPLLFPEDDQKKLYRQEGAIILDDNCTTCSTLQLARDFLVLMGADILGAITVRFPGVNRAMQMALPNHGMPDPEILFGFVRGLVNPSPYARLLAPTMGENGYLDSTGVFDKSRMRIERYLKKNGTPPL